MHSLGYPHVLPASVPTSLQPDPRCPQGAHGVLHTTEVPSDFSEACQAILQGFLAGTVDAQVVALKAATLLNQMSRVLRGRPGASRLNALIADATASALMTMAVPCDQRETHVLQNLLGVVRIAEAPCGHG